jgi:hypothetical protein
LPRPVELVVRDLFLLGEEPELTTLRNSLTGLAASQRATEATRIALHETQDKTRRRYVQVAKIVEGIFRLADMDAEADRLRVVRRKTQAAASTSRQSGVTSDEGQEAQDGAALS